MQKALADPSEVTLASGPGRPRFSNTLSDRETFHSTSRQAQRWISREIQSRFSASQDIFTEQNISGIEFAKDYVIDDVSGKSSIYYLTLENFWCEKIFNIIIPNHWNLLISFIIY